MSTSPKGMNEGDVFAIPSLIPFRSGRCRFRHFVANLSERLFAWCIGGGENGVADPRRASNQGSAR
jgi:hypothetical protein